MKDNKGNPLEIGDKVFAYNPENGNEFVGTIEGIKTDTDGSFYAEVSDQDYNIFCLNSDDLILENN